jgi:AcrR family transcriptional regulator
MPERDAVRARTRRSLYRKLPPGPTGLGREQVTSDQRARLHGATIDAVFRQGYAATTVADLVQLAGVSRRTFYEHFDSKESCFLASYDLIVSDAMKRIVVAYQSEREGLARVCGTYEAFVAELVKDPRASRLALIDVLAVGRGARERADSLHATFQATMLASSSEVLEGVTLPPAIVKGILAGLRQVAWRRLLDERLDELTAIRDELLRWGLAYNSPAANRLAPTDIPKEPRPPQDRPKSDDRMRMLQTAGRLAALHGYAQLTPALIIGEAHVPYERFFEYYENTEQCFLAALELLSAEALTLTHRVAQGARDWPDAMRRIIEAWLCHIARNPTYARVAFVEIFATGLAGMRLGDQLLARITELFASSAPSSQRPSRVVAEAIVGAVWGLTYDQIVCGEAHRLPELVEYATYLALAPVTGAEEAVERIVAAR